MATAGNEPFHFASCEERRLGSGSRRDAGMFLRFNRDSSLLYT